MAKKIRLPYKPFPVFIPFHRATTRFVALMGAVGSGKTVALCADAIEFGLHQPGSRILIARNTVNSLKDTTETEFVNLISRLPDDEEELGGKTLWDYCEVKRGGGHIEKIVFPNGTEYLFRSLDDWRKHMSLNLAYIGVDEASEISVDAFNGLRTRLRQKVPTAMAAKQGYKWDSQPRQKMVVASNPNGHDWIWHYFINGELENSQAFRSTSFDNPTLYDEDGKPDAYLQSLLQMPEIWVKRYVLCEFDNFEGQILDFDPTEDVVEYFAPPPDWDRGMGLDWGLRNPTAVVWWARDPRTGIWYQYREWQTYDPTVSGARESHVTMDAVQVAAKIKAIEGNEKIKYRVADPRIQNRADSGGRSVEFYFQKHGLYFRMGLKDYQSRINALNHLLTSGQLKLMSNCGQTGYGFQNYRWANLRGDMSDGREAPVKKDDHLVDASQYLATLFWSNFTLPAAKAPLLTEEEQTEKEIQAAIRNQVRRRATSRAQYA